MKLVWTQQARQDRAAIWDYIFAENPGAAARIDLLFSQSAERLRAFPRQGREGAIPGTREIFPHPSYRLVYEVGDDIVYIITIVHAARNWPLSADMESDS